MISKAVVFVEGPDAVGKDYFIAKLTTELQNLGYYVARPVVVKDYLDDKTKGAVKNKVKYDESTVRAFLQAHQRSLNTLSTFHSSTDNILIFNRSLFSMLVYNLLADGFIYDEDYKRASILHKDGFKDINIKHSAIYKSSLFEEFTQITKELKTMLELYPCKYFINLYYEAFDDSYLDQYLNIAANRLINRAQNTAKNPVFSIERLNTVIALYLNNSYGFAKELNMQYLPCTSSAYKEVGTVINNSLSIGT